ncbi:MAG: hypothetical protein QOE33_1390 [Acidobacteriota bacterium]|nr:hypothetical protein [Acidobacteriota bacterium]
MKRIVALAVIVLAVATLVLAKTRLNVSGSSPNNSVAADCSTLTFLTESLPDFHLDQPALFQIEAIGGNPPYHFEITSGTIPAGLHLNANGKITGKPTEVTDTVIFVLLTDSAGCHLTQAFTIRVV